MWIESMTESGSSRFWTRVGVGAHGHERLDHRHEPPLGESGDGVAARLEGRRRAGVVERDAGQHLAAVEPVGGDGVGVVGGEPVVELEDGALQAAAVHRPDDDLVVEEAGEQQVLEHVGGAEHAVDTGPLERRGEPVEQRRPGGHGAGVVPHGERTAGRVVGGDEQQTAVVARCLTVSARRPGGGHGIRLGDAAHGEAGGVDGGHAVAPSIRSSTSRSVGIAVEHSSRDADDGAGAVGEAKGALEVPALEQPVAEGAAEGVAGPEAVGDLDRHRRHDEPLARRGHGEHALGPLLDDGELDPAVEQRLGGVLGVVGARRRRGTPRRFPMATVLAAMAAPAARVASDSSRQNCGR